MSHLSFIAHAFMWGGNKPEKILPEVISKPWVKLSKYLEASTNFKLCKLLFR